MPVPQEKLDRLTELLVDQLLSELEKAKEEGRAVDPRRIVAAQRLLESSNPKAFKASAEIDEATGQVVPPKKVNPTDTPEHRVLIDRIVARGILPFPNPEPREDPDGEQ
jgi:hypothetical protein